MANKVLRKSRLQKCILYNPFSVVHKTRNVKKKKKMIPLISGQVVQLDQKRNHAFKIKVSFQFINKKKKIYIIFYQSVL